MDSGFRDGSRALPNLRLSKLKVSSMNIQFIIWSIFKKVIEKEAAQTAGQ